MLLHVNPLIEGCVQFELFLNALLKWYYKLELVLKVLSNG